MVTMQDILRRSSAATCGFTEREVVVAKSNKAAVIRKIKQKGFIFVGTGPAGPKTTKVWFARTALL